MGYPRASEIKPIKDKSDPPGCPGLERVVQSILPITAHEIDEAISKLKPHSAPGPDKILSIMLTQLGPILSEALLATYQACWSQATCLTSGRKKIAYTCRRREKRTIPTLSPTEVSVSQVQLVRPLSVWWTLALEHGSKNWDF